MVGVKLQYLESILEIKLRFGKNVVLEELLKTWVVE